MGCETSTSRGPEDRERSAWNQALEQQLKRDAHQIRKTLKLLLLGAGDTSKSTFFRQLNVLHGTGSIGTDAENKALLHRNIILAIQALISGAKSSTSL